MKLISKTTVLAAATIAMAGAAQAQDFSGGYVGLYAGDAINTSATFAPLGGVYAGYNFSFGGGILGAEVSATYGAMGWAATNAFTGMVDGRVGAEVTPDVLVYAKGGLGYTTQAAGYAVYDLGAGAEYMVTPEVSLRAEFDRVAPLAGGFAQHDVNLGVGYNF